MDADARVQTARRVPGLVAHPGHVFTHGAGALHRQGSAIAGNHVAALIEAGDTHLHAFQRRIHIAGGTSGAYR